MFCYEIHLMTRHLRIVGSDKTKYGEEYLGVIGTEIQVSNRKQTKIHYEELHNLYC
jgi:hypothetical protein